MTVTTVVSGGLYPGAARAWSTRSPRHRRRSPCSSATPTRSATREFLTAVQLFSFADYQANFGGFFSSPWQPDYVGQAVYQFFLNGGPTCYVVGLQAQQYFTYSGSPPQLTAQDAVVPASSERRRHHLHGPAAGPRPHPTRWASRCRWRSRTSGRRPSPADTADIVISYGTTVETYRKVQISDSRDRTAGLEPGDGGTVEPAAGERTRRPARPSRSAIPPATCRRPGGTVINPLDFAPVFADYTSLDKVPVFNLLATPGITDNGVTSEAVAYCERKRAFYIMDTPSPQAPGWDANTIVTRPQRVARVCPRPPRQHQRRGLLPVARDDRPGHRGSGPRPRRAGSWPGSTARRTARRGSGSPRPASRRPCSARRASIRTGVMTDPQQGVLNQNAINCLRQFPGIGTVVFGAQDDGRRRREHRAAAVEVRGRAADGAVHRADPVRQPHLGGVRSRTPHRCGTP